MLFRNDYWFLSNMYPSSITLDGITFSCAESAFQAMKCTNKEDVIALSKMNGKNAKAYGRRVSLRNNWNSVRVNAMRYVVSEKFKQNPDLLRKLKSIVSPIIEDNTWNDTFWGRYNGVGKNHLGIILEEVKTNLN